jgi:diaminopimelate epimerase
MKFTKMHGIGNDYIYVNCLEGMDFDPVRTSVVLSDRHFGVGSDGMILICPSDKADFRMRMFNADGSEGKMCGNGIRCFAKYVYCKGLTDKTVIAIETLAGIKTARLTVENGDVTAVRVNMGSPELKPSRIPVLFDGDRMVSEAMEAGGRTWKITAVSMGNPHCVTFVEDVEALDLEKIGPAFEHHPLFPERVNTEFVQPVDDTTVKMRVWERGSGETWACGTGACAVAVASVLNGIVKSDCVLVKLRGGDLFIEWDKNSNTVYMTGPATFVYEGEVALTCVRLENKE